MGRTPDWSKRHSIMLKSLESKRSQASKNLANQKEWPLLRSDQQEFLSYYAVNGDVKRAADEAQVTLAWVHEQEQDENFAFVMRNITQRPRKMALQLALNALPLSVHLLVQEIKQTPKTLFEKKFRLDAIRHLHKLTGLQQTPDVGSTSMMQVNFDLQGLQFNADNSLPKIDPSEAMIDSQGYVLNDD